MSYSAESFVMLDIKPIIKTLSIETLDTELRELQSSVMFSADAAACEEGRYRVVVHDPALLEMVEQLIYHRDYMVVSVTAGVLSSAR
jgi:hypothetical protein